MIFFFTRNSWSHQIAESILSLVSRAPNALDPEHFFICDDFVAFVATLRDLHRFRFLPMRRMKRESGEKPGLYPQL